MKTNGKEISLEETRVHWCQLVAQGHPLLNPVFIKTSCEQVVQQAHRLSVQYKVNFKDTSLFLLMRSRAWIISGLPVGQVVSRLPKNLRDLGALVISEGGKDGQPLSREDLRRSALTPGG
jgi:hypothetical protein